MFTNCRVPGEEAGVLDGDAQYAKNCHHLPDASKQQYLIANREVGQQETPTARNERTRRYF